MRKILTVAWLMVPVGVAAYHYGPGQRQMELERAGALIREAEALCATSECGSAVDAYTEAIAALPEGETATLRRLRLERAKAQMEASGLPDAHRELQALLDDVGGDEAADEVLVADVRSSLANAQYYMTWLMRLEGQAEDLWRPEIEASRQHYRLLAERAEASGDGDAASGFREDLEASVRLARMDLGELQGLPLPSQ